MTFLPEYCRENIRNPLEIWARSLGPISRSLIAGDLSSALPIGEEELSVRERVGHCLNVEASRLSRSRSWSHNRAWFLLRADETASP